jgi:hypothetical protein
MAGLDPAIPTSTVGAADGRVKPGHDGTICHRVLKRPVIVY